MVCRLSALGDGPIPPRTQSAQISRKQLRSSPINNMYFCSLSQVASNGMKVMKLWGGPDLPLAGCAQMIKKRLRFPPINHILVYSCSLVKGYTMVCRSQAQCVVLAPLEEEAPRYPENG